MLGATEDRVEELIYVPKIEELAREAEIDNIKETIKHGTHKYEDALKSIQKKYNAEHIDMKHYSDYIDMDILDQLNSKRNY